MAGDARRGKARQASHVPHSDSQPDPQPSPQPAAAQPHLLHRVHLSSEEGVYGLILVAGLIAVAGSTGQGPLQTLAFIVITVVVFWAAHVYAGAVAEHSSIDGASSGGRSLRTSIRHAMRRSRGLLTATIPPAIPLVLSACGLLEIRFADWLALWVVVGVLGVLGYLAYRRKGAPLHLRLVGALTPSLR